MSSGTLMTRTVSHGTSLIRKLSEEIVDNLVPKADLHSADLHSLQKRAMP